LNNRPLRCGAATVIDVRRTLKDYVIRHPFHNTQREAQILGFAVCARQEFESPWSSITRRRNRKAVGTNLSNGLLKTVSPKIELVVFQKYFGGLRSLGTRPHVLSDVISFFRRAHPQ